MAGRWAWRFASVLAVLISAKSADAAWFHTKGNDDPFKGGAEHIAMAVELDGFSAGFRCTSLDDLTLLFIVPEKPEPEHLTLAKALPIKLLVIIDDGGKIELDAALETTPDRTSYRVASSDERVAEIARSAASARRRFALAAETLGKIMWSKSFNVSGSTRALKPLIAGCGLSRSE